MHQFIHACAGAGKTQSIVKRCSSNTSRSLKIAVTLTQTGQRELEERLMQCYPAERRAKVSGWYSFLLQYCIRPYLPLVFPGMRLGAFSYKGETPELEKWRQTNLKFFAKGTSQR